MQGIQIAETRACLSSFPKAPLKANEALENIQGNLTGMPVSNIRDFHISALRRGGILFSLFRSAHLSVQPAMFLTVRPSIHQLVRPSEKIAGIVFGTNDLKFSMLMYDGQIQNWLGFGHGLFIFLILF